MADVGVVLKNLFLSSAEMNEAHFNTCVKNVSQYSMAHLLIHNNWIDIDIFMPYYKFLIVFF